MIAEIWVTFKDVCNVASVDGSGKNDGSIKGRKSRVILPPADKQWSHSCEIAWRLRIEFVWKFKHVVLYLADILQH